MHALPPKYNGTALCSGPVDYAAVMSLKPVASGVYLALMGSPGATATHHLPKSPEGQVGLHSKCWREGIDGCAKQLQCLPFLLHAGQIQDLDCQISDDLRLQFGLQLQN